MEEEEDQSRKRASNGLAMGLSSYASAVSGKDSSGSKDTLQVNGR
jgi:hypothetical protein